MALEMQRLCATLTAPDGSPVVMRIGLHCGPVIGGIVGGNMIRYQCVDWAGVPDLSKPVIGLYLVQRAVLVSLAGRLKVCACGRESVWPPLVALACPLAFFATAFLPQRFCQCVDWAG